MLINIVGILLAGFFIFLGLRSSFKRPMTYSSKNNNETEVEIEKSKSRRNPNGPGGVI